MRVSVGCADIHEAAQLVHLQAGTGQVSQAHTGYRTVELCDVCHGSQLLSSQAGSFHLGVDVGCGIQASGLWNCIMCVMGHSCFLAQKDLFRKEF